MVTISEMSMRGPNFDKVAQKFGEENSQRWLVQGEYIADIEQFRVLKYESLYSVWSGDILVAFTSLNHNVVDDVWVSEEYRGQKIFSKILWFYKTRLNVNPIVLGKVHSPAMQEVVTGLSRFKKSWENIATGERIEYSPVTADRFYSGWKVTDWRLILENDGDFSDWPKFATGKSFIYENYSEYIS